MPANQLINWGGHLEQRGEQLPEQLEILVRTPGHAQYPGVGHGAGKGPVVEHGDAHLSPTVIGHRKSVTAHKQAELVTYVRKQGDRKEQQMRKNPGEKGEM